MLDAHPLEPASFLGDGHARFSFSGRFDGRDVTWHCDLHTLKHYAQLSRPAQASCELRQFLDIAPSSRDHEYDIRIGLALDNIDDAAIMKTIIMVRNYKRLAVGRHEYGEAVSICSS